MLQLNAMTKLQNDIKGKLEKDEPNVNPIQSKPKP